MQLHQLKPLHRKKARQRVGRGGKKGTYSGRGLKGQKARAGKKPRPDFTGGNTPLSKRFPKLRGQTGKLKIRRGVKLARFKIKPVALNLEEIEKKFKSGEIVSLKNLLKKGLISRIKGKVPPVKILGKGELTKKLIFQDVIFSKQAKQKVNKVSKKKKTVHSSR